jgi:CHAT domain
VNQTSLLDERQPLLEAAEHLIFLDPRQPEDDRMLAGALEGLYRFSRNSQDLARLAGWLEWAVLQTPLARPWLTLVRLALTEPDGNWRQEWESLDRSLIRVDGRTALVLRTEAARHVRRITGDHSAAWELLAREPLPNPEFAEAAVEAMVIRLRLAATTGNWEAHDQLARAVDSSWAEIAGQESFWLGIVIAEHHVLRGFYAAAIGQLRSFEAHPDLGLQLAALGVRLHALVACGGYLPGEALQGEIDRTARLLEPLLALAPSPGGIVPAEEWQERRRRGFLLLKHALSDPQTPGDPRVLGPLDAFELADQNRESALSLAESALQNPELQETPEMFLRLRLLWIRLTLDLSGGDMAQACESLVTVVIDESRNQGLPVLEAMAWDQRAILRARFFIGRWPEAVSDAGKAANLAARVLNANQGSIVERSLRLTLLPMFDRAVELLVEGALRAVAEDPDPDSQERFGRALLDYVEQSMELALTEARSLMRSGDRNAAPPIPDSRSNIRLTTSRDLQASLLPREAVLQYFLISRYLLVFAYGQGFFTWHAEEVPPVEDHPIPIRSLLEPYIPRWEEFRALLVRQRDVDADPALRDAGRRRWEFNESNLRQLSEHLLPSAILDILDRERIRRLTIIPHDILYRVPFGRLPWRETRLRIRFGLTLQPTGASAGRRHPAPRRRGRKTRLGFFIGPRILYAQEEHRVVRDAFRRGAEVVPIDTSESERSFEHEAPGFDVLYLACHGSSPQGKPQDAHLLLGPLDQALSLPEISRMDLSHCRLAVLQACWTGWMDHLRESPVQGFPQGLQDAGVAAVVAPMSPVADALCPIFSSVFCRTLKFLPVSNALALTLEVLRKHGEIFAATPSARLAWRRGTFDAYEYRFTGDPALSLAGGWLSRQMARLRFHYWLWSQTRGSARGGAKPAP